MQHWGGADRQDLQAGSGESLSWRGSLFDWLLAWIPAMHQKPNTAGWAWEKGTGTRRTGVAGGLCVEGLWLEVLGNTAYLCKLLQREKPGHSSHGDKAKLWPGPCQPGSGLQQASGRSPVV